jgi:myo-inositol-1(or 4)-monophosphatase
MMTSPKTFLPEIEALAHGAGTILLKHFRRLRGVTKKGAIDLQTIADRQSEAFLLREIARRFPDHSVLAEENGTIRNPGSDYLWVVDPLDGTTNYTHGLRIFAVSIGLLYKGDPIAGGIFAPALDELYLTAKGHGSRRNGKKITVSSATKLTDSLVVTGFPYDRVKHMDVISAMHRTMLEKTRGVLRLGAASLDMAMVASGNLDGFYEFGLKPWDMAAGTLLITEAGGKVTGLDGGRKFDLFQGRCLATNGKIHAAMGRALKEQLRGSTLDDPQRG